MEGEVPMSHYEFRKAIVLDKVDSLGNDALPQREPFFPKGRPKGHVKNDKGEQGQVHLQEAPNQVRW